MCVCVCVCVCVCMCDMCIRIYVRMHIHTYIQWEDLVQHTYIRMYILCVYFAYIRTDLCQSHVEYGMCT